MPSAFISHSSPDDRYVQEMVRYLHTLGYDDIFNDGHTIAPDELFWNRIEKGIRECDAFVVILSHPSVTSYWVDSEVQFARELVKNGIPIRIDDASCRPASTVAMSSTCARGAATKSSSPRHASPNIRRRSSSAATIGSMRSTRHGRSRR